MASIVEMPKLSDTMEEGAIANWLKKEGDAVKEGEALCEIETDKATMEYQSPESGTILKIIVGPGKAVALNAPIAVIGKKGESFDLDALFAKAEVGAAAPAAKGHPAPAVAQNPAALAARPAALALEPKVTPVIPSPTASLGHDRLRASPLARKMASEMGLNLAGVAGSGPGGRIVMRDVEEAKSKGGMAVPGVATVLPLWREDHVTPVSMMRKTIAKRLLSGKNEAPHFYLTVSANVEQMQKWRAQLNSGLDDKPGAIKVSMNDLVIFAVAKALRQHPGVNASWQGETIVEYGNVHVAMAVALPTGLVTPVVRNTDQLGVKAIAATTRDLAAKAKSGQLANEDYAGGTFTVSNLGMFGIEEFTAIINPPQAAILAVGAAMSRPWVDDKGAVAVQSRMKMTMSCDHRVVDGAMGAQFLQTLVKYIEQPLGMME